MYRELPVVNRPIFEKMLKKDQQRHKQRLKQIKRQSIGFSMNRSYSLCNKKAQLKQQQQHTQIEKQNTLLFNRMMRITRRIDPYNQPRNTFTANIRTKTLPDMSRITQQNRILLSKLQNLKPTISNKKLYEERQKHLNILKYLGRYPNVDAFRQTRNQRVVTQCIDTTIYTINEQQQSKNIKLKSPKKLCASIENRKRFHSQTLMNYQNPKQFRQQKTKSYRNKSQTINLYESKLTISHFNIILKIIRNYTNYQINAYSSDKKEQFQSLILNQVQGNFLFEQYDYNYPEIIKLLEIKDNKIWFVDKNIFQKLSKYKEDIDINPQSIRINSIVQNSNNLKKI